jgi:HlyD family secretion protein
MKMNASPRKIVFWSAGLLALVVLAWLAMREPVQMASVAQVRRGPLEQAFTEEGKTRIQQRYVITAPLAGVVRRITLQPGDVVQARQVVAEIDPTGAALLDPRARILALADVSTGESALKALRQRVAAAATAEAVAREELGRMQQLRAQGMVTASQLDQARNQAETASATLSTARSDEQIGARRLQVAKATLADEGQAGRGKVLPVAAPVAGRVLKRHVESTTAVAMGQPLLEVGDPALLEIEVEVLSTDAVRLAPGLKARVLRWGGQGVLDARVARIEPGGFTKVSALGVEEQRTRVILDFASPRAQWAALGDAYRVEVEFILQQDQDVLQVPASALFRAGEGWAVYVVDGGAARRTVVKVGARSATAAQVLDGLQADQTVIVQPDDRIKDGTRIEAVSGR